MCLVARDAVPQTLCAVYATTCLPAATALLEGGGPGIQDLLSQVRLRHVSQAGAQAMGATSSALSNVNAMADLGRAREALGPLGYGV